MKILDFFMLHVARKQGTRLPAGEDWIAHIELRHPPDLLSQNLDIACQLDDLVLQWEL